MSLIKLSKPSKMPCRSWSLEALRTCPAAKKPDGSLVDACRGCYATQGNYNFPSVRGSREHNRTDWKRDEWVQDMVQALDNDRYFRWFDSGDMYDLKLAEKILEVMIATPWCNHWLPTRMHKIKRFQGILSRMEALPNVVIRLSSDSVRGEVVPGNTSSTIIGDDQLESFTGTICKSYENQGKCGTCRACWSKDVPVVAYVQHGAKMKKVNREALIQIQEVA